MHPLDGPRLKVRRAESEIQALRLVEKTFRKNSDYRVIKAEFNPKSGKYRYRVRIGSAPPDPEWGVWIGEIAHNLRSALDGLVHQLALQHLPRGKAPAGNTQFPIFLLGKTKRTYRGTKNLIAHFEGMELRNGRSMIRDLKPEHQTSIERLQPYKSGRRGLQCPLYWLKEINNADKHRLIQVVGSKVGAGPFIGGWGDDPNLHFTFQPGKILVDGAIFDEFASSVHVNPRVIPLIAFWEGCPQVKGKAVANTLRIITEDVSKIIESFGPELS
jgi:hypothetical protein